jgi:hypothetical protein
MLSSQNVCNRLALILKLQSAGSFRRGLLRVYGRKLLPNPTITQVQYLETHQTYRNHLGHTEPDARKLVPESSQGILG